MSSSGVCSDCGRKILGVKYTVGGKTYCYDCYQRVLASATEIEDQKKELYDYICGLYSIPEVPQETVAAIDRLYKTGKKLKAMGKTLWFYHAVEGHPINTPNLIGYIIEQNYDRAKKYLEEVKSLKEHNKNVDISVEPITIKIKPASLHKKPHTVQTVKIEDL